MTDAPQTPADPPEDDDLLAAEFVLRLLPDAALADARRRLREDDGFARAVAAWEDRLAPLAEALPPEPPRAAVRQALLDRLFAEGPATASDDAAFGFARLQRRIGLWRTLSLASLLLAAAFGWLAFAPEGPEGGPLYTAEIAAEAGDFRVVAVVDKSRDEVILTRTRGEAPPGRILQVWAHGPGEPALSVGLWPQGETVRLPLPPVIAAVEGVLTLGVSEEPPGGSPTGSPSGRVFGTVDIPGVTDSP